jgi:hypothetical protein
MKSALELVKYHGSAVEETFIAPQGPVVEVDGLHFSLTTPEEGVFLLRADATRAIDEFGIDVVLTWSDWKQGYILVPGAVYDGNNFPVLDRAYPPIYDEEDPTEKGPVMTDLPRSPAFHLLAADASFPGIGLWDPKGQIATVILFPVRCSLGMVGFRVEEDFSGLQVRIQFPGVRYGSRFAGFRRDLASEDRGASLTSGGTVEARMVVESVPAESVSDFFRTMDEQRNRCVPPGNRREIRPFSSAADLVAQDMECRKWRPDRGFFETADGSWGTIDFQVGWVGGGMETLPLVELGNSTVAGYSRINIDFICDRMQSVSGYFFGGIRDSIANDGFGHPHAEHWVMVRKSGDMLLFLIRHILSESMPSVKWTNTARGCADAFVKTWDASGEWGQFVDARDGQVVIGGSACGGTAIAALALASKYFANPRYLEVARAAADGYVRTLRQGILNGGPGEILKAPDSESAFGLLEGYILLWETTREAAWLDLAAETAYQAASWVVAYDFPFPEESSFGQLDMGSAGTVIANIQNKHSAPGICTASALPLLKLFRATGSRRWLDLAVEISHSLPQFVSSGDRPIRADDGRYLPTGWVNERVNMSDWEAPERGPGEVFYGRSWSSVSMLLTCLEMPGVYVQPHTGLVACADHVSAELKDGNLTITNSTAYPARIQILIDESPDEPLGELWWRKATKACAAPGETISVPVGTAKVGGL